MRALIALALSALIGAPAIAATGPSKAEIRWPEGTRVIPFENLEGVILLMATLHGEESDTTGPLVLDTGAGYLALDRGLAVELGLVDAPGESGEVGLTTRPLPRLEFGGGQYDQVSPVLTVDGDVMRRVTDRPVLGLIGQRPFASFAVCIDYATSRVALVPAAGDSDERPAAGRSGDARDAAAGVRSGEGRETGAVAASRAVLGGAISAAAVAVPFRLAGDGKIVIAARLSDPRPPRFSRWLNFILDTGATKCVGFEAAIESEIPRAREWRAVRGLSAPTLLGAASAYVARVPELELLAARGTERLRGLDMAVIRGELGDVLSRATGETIHGLLGYSFLKRYRVAIDYPHRVLWLEHARPSEADRPWEYSHVGLQLERDSGAARVVAVAEGSPAARAGIEAGDELVAVDGAAADTIGIIELSRRLEGPPGSSVSLLIRRGNLERTFRLARRRLL